MVVVCRHLFATKKSIRVMRKCRLAPSATEEILGPLVIVAVLGRLGINLHAADGIACFNLHTSRMIIAVSTIGGSLARRNAPTINRCHASA